MTDADIKTISEKIESLHKKILESKFAEKVAESEMMSLILAVQTINRQKAEIERLNAKFERLMKEQLEKELFEGNHYSFHNGKLCAIPKTEEKQIKSYAYKEFSERLKEKTRKYIELYGWCTGYGTFENIDNTYKELTEGGNEE